MMTRSTLIPACCAALLLVASVWPASAQVLRCTDTRTGKVTYTNDECERGTRQAEIEARKTPEQLEIERQQTAAALEQKRLQQQNDAAIRKQEAETARLNAATRQKTQVNNNVDRTQSNACQQSRRALTLTARETGSSAYQQNLRMAAAQRQVDLDCLDPQTAAQLEEARSANTQPIFVVPPRRPYYLGETMPQRYLKGCGSFYCTDNTGKQYPREGPGQFNPDASHR